MSLHSYSTGNPPGGQEHRGRFEALAARQFADAKDNPVVLRAADARIGPEEPIPDRKHRAVIAVGLLEYD